MAVSRRPARKARQAISRSWLGAGASFVLFGMIVIAIYAARVPPGWTVFASTLMLAGAALAAGGLIGFLFGIPRTLTGETRAADATAGAGAIAPAYGANTNLEQISDWLTKILVGIGLAQFGAIRSGAIRLLAALAPSLGGRPFSGAFAGTVLVYHSVLGFLAGWLLTRLMLAPALSESDRRVLALQTAADLAESEGDMERAAQYRQEALSLLQRASPTASRYEQLRRTAAPGPTRTWQMEQMIAEAGQDARKGDLDREQTRALFEQGVDGLRIYALGAMQANEELADFEVALAAIAQSKSAFEQYHGLELARRMLPSLDDGQRRRLVEILQQQRGTGGWIKPGMDRWALSQEILDAIGGQEV
jgi:hypothetical protein